LSRIWRVSDNQPKRVVHELRGLLILLTLKTYFVKLCLKAPGTCGTTRGALSVRDIWNVKYYESVAGKCEKYYKVDLVGVQDVE
jgi:hypothetical protein